MMTTILVSLFAIGWVAAAVIGTLAYFLGEQTKPIHQRNWQSDQFEQLARAVTGQSVDYAQRVPAFDVGSYATSKTFE